MHTRANAAGSASEHLYLLKNVRRACEKKYRLSHDRVVGRRNQSSFDSVAQRGKQYPCRQGCVHQHQRRFVSDEFISCYILSEASKRIL